MMINELNHHVKNTLATGNRFSGRLAKWSDPKVIRESIDSACSFSRSDDLSTRENREGVGLLDLVNEAIEPSW